jgi:hypothetical protein
MLTPHAELDKARPRVIEDLAVADDAHILLRFNNSQSRLADAVMLLASAVERDHPFRLVRP